MRVVPLQIEQLAEATRVLAASCAFDRAAEVAREKLFGAGPVGTPHAFAAYEGDVLVGVAGVCARWLRVLAVDPSARRRGIGSELLATCERHARDGGEPRLRALDQPGNYLAPGIDERNAETIAWLAKRGWQRNGDARCNVLIDVHNNPRVTQARADELADAARARGYEIRRAVAGEAALLAAVGAGFGGAWPFELACALEHSPAGVHVALKAGVYCAFAAHDGNNRGLGWFGPTGTWPEHRGQKLGEALLVACLVDVARDHDRCEVAWIGPRPFYEKVAGIAAERTFAAMAKSF
ncbi:MAG TPA: GNAT family N-acetyltransferase [Kofleriaceae bacterium]|jgi:GNAT superfamily N-acetyltransferase